MITEKNALSFVFIILNPTPMKFNLVFIFSLIIGLLIVSCSAENGEIGMQDEDYLFAIETGGGEEVSHEGPIDE